MGFQAAWPALGLQALGLQALGLPALGLIVAMSLACSSRSPEASQSDSPEPAPVATPVATPTLALSFDAGPTPSKEEAVEVLERFSACILARDLEGAKAEMRIPEGLNDNQVAFFLRELGNGEHMSAEGLAAIRDKDFGPLRERFGDKAAAAAEAAQLPLDEAFALGDLDQAAVFCWDGKRFWVSALHHLGPDG